MVPGPSLDLSRPLPYLPNEIVEKILLFATGPFHHQAVITTTPFAECQESATTQSFATTQPPTTRAPATRAPATLSRIVLGVYKRREWKDIMTFQLSRDFCATAITIYGQPCRDMFPVPV